MPPPPDAAASLLHQVALSGAAVSVANTCTIPLDVLKVRLQLQPQKLGLVSVEGSGGGPVCVC